MTRPSPSSPAVVPAAPPRFAARVAHLGGEGAEAWQIHYEAMAAKRSGADVIVLSVGDPDAATPAPIVAAAVAALRAGDTHYAEVQGRLPLRQAIASRHARNTGVETGPENVVLSAGAQNALFAMALCLLQDGDEVLVPQPMYVTYAATIRASGAALVPVPARPGGFRLDPAALAAAVTPRTRAIFLATPSNPCGTVMTEAELAAVARIARDHDLWVVSDEVYAELAFERPHRSIAALPGMAARTATIGSLSKSHAMTGWRVGWAVAPRALVDHAANLALCMLYGLPGFVQQAALEALDLGAAPAAAMRETYRARRDFVLRRLAGMPLLGCAAPEAGMFMVIDVARTGLGAHEFAWALLRRAGVSVLDGAAFGRETAHCVRLSLTEPEAVLGEACDRIARFLDDLKPQKDMP